jgi:hypothetical protein
MKRRTASTRVVVEDVDFATLALSDLIITRSIGKGHQLMCH